MRFCINRYQSEGFTKAKILSVCTCLQFCTQYFVYFQSIFFLINYTPVISDYVKEYWVKSPFTQILYADLLLIIWTVVIYRIGLQQHKASNMIILYHFVGSPSSCSAEPLIMIRRLTQQVCIMEDVYLYNKYMSHVYVLNIFNIPNKVSLRCFGLSYNNNFPDGIKLIYIYLEHLSVNGVMHAYVPWETIQVCYLKFFEEQQTLLNTAEIRDCECFNYERGGYYTFIGNIVYIYIYIYIYI